MPDRGAYIGRPAFGGDTVGVVRGFTADPGAKWSLADGGFIADTGQIYPALAKALGVTWYGDEQPVSVLPFPPGADPKVNPADGSIWVVSLPQAGAQPKFFRTTNGGDAWSPVAYPTLPVAARQEYPASAVSHAIGPGVHVLLQSRNSVGDGFNVKYYSVHRTVDNGATWQVVPMWNGLAENVDHWPLEPSSVQYALDLGLFVLTANGGKVYSSVDGLTWTLRLTANVGPAASVRWVPSVRRFYVAGGAKNFAHSLDGVNWTLAALPSGVAGLPYVYPGGLFMGGPSIWSPLGNIATPPFFSSTDGLTWVAVAIPPLQQLDPSLGTSGPTTVVAAMGAPEAAVLLIDRGATAVPRYGYYSTANFAQFLPGSTTDQNLLSEFFVVGKYAYRDWTGGLRFALRSGIRKPACAPIGARKFYIKLKD
jgi:hypothetical protein